VKVEGDIELMDTPKVTSQRRQQASRRNGALSNGPVTPEGKARSSGNAVTHGCLATLLTFTPGDAELFNRIHAEYIARFEPRDQVEHDFVEEIVRAKWQMRQAWTYESSTLGLQAAQDAEQVGRAWKSLGQHDCQALALTASLKAGSTIPNLQRYSRSLALQADRAMKMLMELKKQRLPPAGQPGQEDTESEKRNEPSPISGHPDPLPESPVIAVQPAARQVHAYAITPAAPRIPAESTIETPRIPVPLRANAAGA
jgi:hypothetical protein